MQTTLKHAFLILCLMCGSQNLFASSKAPIEKTPSPSSSPNQDIETFCKALSKKLRTVQYQGCLELDLQVSSSRSVEGRALTYREYLPDNIESVPKLPKGRILFLSGIHGDEYSSISITYLWMLSMLKHPESTQQHWLFLPLANPDGLFGRKPATRMNANGVDLNRNFPSPDWEQLAQAYWKHYYHQNKRRYPGESPASEPETQWMVKTIERFKPDAIISVHAPYGLIDYDGPEHATPNNIGGLKHKELGTYPGSLGRYAGEYLNIPVLTLELNAAGTMPSEKEIYNMWQDIEKWAQEKLTRKETDF